MKRISIAILTLFLASFLLHPARSQWVRTNGPYSAPVLSMVRSGACLFAGTETGLFLSSDGGNHWSLATEGIPIVEVRALAARGTTVFAGTGGNGFYCSINNGASWEESSSLLAYISALAVSDTFVFAGRWDSVYRSSDNGTSWEPVTASPLHGEILTFLVSGRDLFVGTADGVFISSDWGSHWTAANGGLPGEGILALAKRDTNLYAGVNFKGIYRSTNNGKEWAPVNNGMPADRVQAFAVTSSGIYAGVYRGGVYRSTNNGESWAVVKAGLWNRDVRALATIGDTLFAGAHYGGIFRTIDGGTSWSPASVGVARSYIQNLAASGSHLFGGTNCGLFETTDYGDTWTEVEVGRPAVENFTASVVRTDSAGKRTVFAGTWYGVVYRSMDDGESWTPVDTTESSNLIGAFAVSGPNVVAATFRSMFISTNNGVNWSTVPTGYSTDGIDDLVASGTNLYAAGGYSGVFRSTDHGWTWTASDTGLLDVDIHCLAACETYLLAGTQRLRNWAPGVYRSTDNGSNWTHVDWTLDWINAFKVIGTRVFAGTADGVFASTDSGATWVNVSTGMGEAFGEALVEALETDGTYLYAGTTGRGVWRRPLSEMIASVPQTGVELPNQFALYQNFPNPFNPTTTIRYSLPHRSNVLLMVFNALGQQVASLVNQDMEAGYHEVTFDASDLASGMYFYRLQAGEFVQTHKLCLLR